MMKCFYFYNYYYYFFTLCKNGAETDKLRQWLGRV